MTTKIKVLKTNGVDGLKIHEVGKDGVTTINDDSVDSEQNFVPGYIVYVDKQLKYVYTNGTYEVEFYDEED